MNSFIVNDKSHSFTLHASYRAKKRRINRTQIMNTISVGVASAGRDGCIKMIRQYSDYSVVVVIKNVPMNVTSIITCYKKCKKYRNEAIRGNATNRKNANYLNAEFIN
jgi:hypothetical protein